jgi:hypothetical protein
MPGRKKTQKFIFFLLIFFECAAGENTFPFNFVDRREDFLFNIKGRIKLSGGPIFWGEFQTCWKGYPLIPTRQLTPQATKGRDEG